jgi:hypothetical protein
VEGVGGEGGDLRVGGARRALRFVHLEHGRLEGGGLGLGVQPRLQETRLEGEDTVERDFGVLLHHQPASSFPARLHTLVSLSLLDQLRMSSAEYEKRNFCFKDFL